MALIANLAVALTAQTGQFASKLKGASKSVQGFASSIAGYATGTTAKLTGLIAAVTGVGSVAALAHFTHEAMEAVDVNAKLADRLGSTIEQLAGLQLAADLGGASTETLNGALDKLTKNLGNGGTAVEDALSALGLTRGGLIGKGAAEQFAEIAEGVKNLGGSENRAAVVTALFGKTGQGLMATLMDIGERGLPAASKEAQKFGLSLSRVDAFKIEAANDAITRLQSLLKGGFIQLGAKAAPIIEAIANKITSFATQGGGVGEMMAKGFTGLVGVLDTVVDRLGKIAAGFELIAANSLDFSAKIRELFPFTTSVIDSLTGQAGLAGKGFTTEQINQNARDTAEALRGSADATRVATAGNSISSLLAPILAEADKIATAAAEKVAKQQALEKIVAPYADKFFQLTKATIPWVKDIFNGAGKYLQSENKINKAYQSVFDARRASAMDPRAELGLSGFYDNKKLNRAIETASAGTRGTFAADTAGRSVGIFNIQKQQLDALNTINDNLEELNANFEGGVPAG